jgi:glycosyltransferase involved in cell wall biosynthesis
MSAPLVSVVIPTYNRCAQLQQVLRAFADQDVPRSDYEIIVVSDGSTDGTDEFLLDEACPFDVLLVQQENQGPAVARNNGVEKSAADLILFVDDDVVPAPELIRVHLERHAEVDDRTVVIGPLLTPDEIRLEPWVEWEQRMLYKQYDAMDRGDWSATARQFYTGNASLRRSLFEESGGFDPEYRRGEDVSCRIDLPACWPVSSSRRPLGRSTTPPGATSRGCRSPRPTDRTTSGCGAITARRGCCRPSGSSGIPGTC